MKPDLESGTSARYKTVRELGHGEHTLVELVYDEKRALLLARKSWERASAELRFRLRQQYRRALSITHPNLVRVYDLVIEPERTALVMEAVDGRDVVTYVRELTLHGASAEQHSSAVLNIMAQLFEALSTLHAAGVVHRDLKPRNVLVENTGRCVLLDAGFTWPPERLFDPARDRMLAGVLPYLAPECLRGALPSVESDWYSFGALSFELLSTQPPFSGNLEGVLRDKDSVAALRPQLTAAPEALANLVCGLMARDPRARPNPDEIWQALANLVQQHPFQTPEAERVDEALPSEPPGKPSHMQLTAAGRAAQVEQEQAELEAQPLAPVEPLPLLNIQPDLIERTFPAPPEPQPEPELLANPEPEPEPEPGPELLSGPEAAEPEPLPLSAAFPSETAVQSDLNFPAQEDALRADNALPNQEPSEAEPTPEEPTAEPLAPSNQQSTEPALAEASRVAESESQPSPEPPSAALQPPAPSLAAEPLRLAELCIRETTPSLTCLRGIAYAGKSRLLAALVEHIQQHSEATVISVRARPTEPLGVLRQIASQLATSAAERVSAALTGLTSAQRGALHKLCPELFPTAGNIEQCAHDPQQQLIDGLIGLRQLCLQLAAARRLIIALDDAHALDPDSASALRALLSAAPSPAIAWLIAQSSDQAPLEPFASLLASAHTPLPVRVHELDPIESRLSRTSYIPAHEAEPVPSLAALGRLELTRMAEAARDTLALQASASLYRLAIERELTADSSLLEAAARAQVAAGKLRAASKLWLGLARSTSAAHEAQRFELEAGGALLRAGDEHAGRAVMRSVLRAVGLHWPRAPLLTSTLERARILLMCRGQQPHTQDLAAHTLRFDALWGVAKQLLLLSPVSGDALSVHALREAVALGDPSRLALALGYEATSEANIGGAFMHKRAAALSGEARELAERAAHAYDRAYARSVAAVVTWFTGDWADAENLLRDALSAYGQVPNTTAHERDVLQSFLVGALEAQGKIPQLREQLSEQRIAALATGHQLTLMLCELSDAGLPALADDRALAAITRADTLLAEHPSEGFTPLHFQHFVVTSSARLYAGHSAQAYQQVEQTWQRVRHSYLPQLDAVAVMLHQLRARAALALAAHSPADESERLRKLAKKLATSLGHSNLAHALALRHVVEANLAMLEKSPERAERHCKRAAEIFDAADMALMREVAYYARASLVEDASAASDKRRAEAFFERMGVRVPAAFTAAWFPVLRERLHRAAQLA